MDTTVLETLLRMCVGGMMVAAAAAKFRNMRAFFEVLRQLKVATAPIPVLFIGLVIPAAEGLIGIALISRLMWPVPAWAALLAMISFALITTSAIVRGVGATCGCFGEGGRLSWTTVVRNVGFALLSAAMFGADVVTPVLVLFGLALVALSVAVRRQRPRPDAEADAAI